MCCKVCWPDDWSEEEGVDVATQKAVAEVARTLIRSHEAAGTLGELEERVKE